MKKLLIRALTLLLAAALLLAVGGGAAGARTREYPSVRVYADGLLIGRAFRAGEVVYLSAADVCAFLGLKAQEHYDREKQLVTVEAEDLALSAEMGMNYMTVNGRYLLILRGILLVDGKPCFPLEQIEKIFNLRTELAPDKTWLSLDLSEARILEGGEDYYERTYGSETVMWLSRLITAEAAGQPFVGMVGVGSVVINRVKSERFPNTVMSVIFDTHNGVQFAPVYDGSIYKDASPSGVIAACVALEGYTTVGGSLFFIAPSLTDDAWLKQYYVYVTTIGEHDFYM